MGCARTKGCVCTGGCASDYVAAGITGVTFILVGIGICFIILKRKDLELNAKKVSVLLLQACASLVYLAGVLMSKSVLKMSRHHLWQNCYLWEIWLEGLFGFGLLLSCHIFRAYRLYYVFTARRLPPLRHYQLLPLLLLPWFLLSAVMQGRRVVRSRSQCSSTLPWQIGIACLHIAYAVMLLIGTWKLRHVRFEFNEYSELLKGSSVCILVLVVWGGLFIAEKDQGLMVTSRFVIIVVINIFVLLLFWIPIAKPMRDLCESRRKKQHKYSTMGQALGVPHSGVVTTPAGFDFTRPLESLLENKKFRQSYLAFADSRLAGEIVHFYDEVRELNKIPYSQVVQRVYMAEHIIDKYIKSGSPMEINISHQMRLEILNTKDLADPDLFNRVVNEALKMMQMNLSSEYWKSSLFQDLKSDLEANAEAQYNDKLNDELGVNKKHVLRKLYASAPDNPFDQSPFSGDLCKEATSEHEDLSGLETSTEPKEWLLYMFMNIGQAGYDGGLDLDTGLDTGTANFHPCLILHQRKDSGLAAAYGKRIIKACNIRSKLGSLESACESDSVSQCLLMEHFDGRLCSPHKRARSNRDFRQNAQRDLVSWNTIIAAYAQKDDLQTA